MKASSQERRHDQVNQGVVRTGEVDEEVIGKEDKGDVYEMVDCGFLRTDESWSEGVEEDLKGTIITFKRR